MSRHRLLGLDNQPTAYFALAVTVDHERRTDLDNIAGPIPAVLGVDGKLNLARHVGVPQGQPACRLTDLRLGCQE